MAGGSGQRLWPLSRSTRTKPFVRPPGANESFLTQTAARCASFPRDRTFVSVNAGLEHLVTQHVPDLPPANIIVEPEKRNTLPSLVLSLAHIAAQFPDATVLIVASDNIVGDDALFADAANRAMQAAEAGAYLVSIGVRPEEPSTRFGYMALSEPYPGLADTWFGSGYVEKPDRSLAQTLFEGGQHDWNTGAFAWTIATFATALKIYVPEAGKAFEMLMTAEDGPARTELYRTLPSVDVDHGLLEHVPAATGSVRHVLVRGAYAWDDLGTFEAFARRLPRDACDNCVSAGVELTDTRNSIVINEGTKPVTVSGLYDQLVVVSDIGDLLVASKFHLDEVGLLHAEPRSEISQSAVHAVASTDCTLDGAKRETVGFLHARGVRVTLEDERITLSQGARLFVVHHDTEFAHLGSELIVEALSRALAQTPGEVLVTMSAGNTPIGIYAALRLNHRRSIDWERIHLVQMDEWVGFGRDDPQSFAYELQEQLVAPFGMQATLLDGRDDEQALLKVENDVVAKGGFAFALHGIGVNGHLGFVEPSSTEGVGRDRAHLADLADTTKHAARTRFDGLSPVRGLTLGLRSITQARKTMLIARGSHKATAIARAMRAPSTTCPASLLPRTGALDLLVDREAATELLGS